MRIAASIFALLLIACSAPDEDRETLPAPETIPGAAGAAVGQPLQPPAAGSDWPGAAATAAPGAGAPAPAVAPMSATDPHAELQLPPVEAGYTRYTVKPIEVAAGDSQVILVCTRSRNRLTSGDRFCVRTLLNTTRRYNDYNSAGL